MSFDENTLTDALHGIDAEVSPDLAARVRAGGRRRLVRRRSFAAAGAVAVGAAAVPVAAAVTGDSGAARLEVGKSPGVTTLYAAPPASGSECSGGHGYKAPATAHPDLLLLPPASQELKYVYVRDQTSNCDAPHIALTAYQRHGDAIGAGVVIEGPNAPTPTEDGREGPHIDFFGNEGHLPIDGQPATEYSLDRIDHTDAFWTEPDGGQWHAVVRDMSQADAVQLLNRMSFDAVAGTATMSQSVQDGWTVAAPAHDRSAAETGWVISQWTDSQGHLVDMTVMQTPDRIFQTGIDRGGDVSLATVRGHQAMLSPQGGDGGKAYGLIWQEAAGVQVQLGITDGTAEEIQQVAESLVLADPNDPRISKD